MKVQTDGASSHRVAISALMVVPQTRSKLSAFMNSFAFFNLEKIQFSKMTFHFSQSSVTKVLWCANTIAGIYLVWFSENLQYSSSKEHNSQDCKSNYRTMDIEAMEASELNKYIHLPDKSCRIVHEFGGHVFPYTFNDEIRFVDGQKSVCMDPDFAPKANNCLVYSFGINNEWTFDDAMDLFGCKVYAFDPSMKQRSHDRSANIHFFDIGIGSVNTKMDSNGWVLRTLDSIYEMLAYKHGAVPIDILKLDVEHTEWVAIPQMIESGILERVRQLAMEIHFYDKDSAADVKEGLKVLKSLEDYGFKRFISRATVISDGSLMGKFGFTAIEMFFYNTKFSVT